MPADIDSLFNKLLQETDALRASGKPKPPKPLATYAPDLHWELEAFVAQVFTTKCLHCGTATRVPGEVFKRSRSKAYGTVVQMSRLGHLGELSSHPGLPRLIEDRPTTSLACPSCLPSLFFKEPADGTTKTA